MQQEMWLNLGIIEFQLSLSGKVFSNEDYIMIRDMTNGELVMVEKSNHIVDLISFMEQHVVPNCDEANRRSGEVLTAGTMIHFGIHHTLHIELLLNNREGVLDGDFFRFTERKNKNETVIQILKRDTMMRLHSFLKHNYDKR